MNDRARLAELNAAICRSINLALGEAAFLPQVRRRKIGGNQVTIRLTATFPQGEALNLDTPFKAPRNEREIIPLFRRLKLRNTKSQIPNKRQAAKYPRRKRMRPVGRREARAKASRFRLED